MDTNTDHFTPLMLRVRGNESLEVVGESEVMMTYNEQIKNFTIREVASETQNLLILIGMYPAQLAINC